MKISKETLDKIMNILSNLPFNQVAGLINEIQREVIELNPELTQPPKEVKK